MLVVTTTLNKVCYAVYNEKKNNEIHTRINCVSV